MYGDVLCFWKYGYFPGLPQFNSYSNLMLLVELEKTKLYFLFMYFACVCQSIDVEVRGQLVTKVSP